MACCFATDRTTRALESPARASENGSNERDDDDVDERAVEVSAKLSRMLTKEQPATVVTPEARARWRRAAGKLAVVTRRTTTTTSARMSESLHDRERLERASSSERAQRLDDGVKALDGRLARCGMKRVTMAGDGNCQFRALAWNMYRDQERHHDVRERATALIEARRQEFEAYFDGARAFDEWLREMKRDRSWGDELTLRAACDAFGCKIHVVQSTSANWHLVYEPERLATKRMVFISYISPVHYDAVTEK